MQRQSREWFAHSRSDVWELPPGVSLTACIHATRCRGANPSLLIHSLEVDLGGHWVRPFTPVERVTLYRILTFVAGIRPDMGDALYTWGPQYGDVADHGFFHRAAMENMVAIICKSTNWELDYEMLRETWPIPGVESPPLGAVGRIVELGVDQDDDDDGGLQPDPDYDYDAPGYDPN